ncbi:MAG TPA: signal peptidase I [Candidatus Binatus sp.]|jgi:signal peptidase I|nr:signal peptidase I [Candidatus Binatus sp.]
MAATATVSQVRVAEKERAVALLAGATSEIPRKIRSHGSVCLRVLGGSMTPWIRSGDLVFIKRYDFERVSAGDVILFEREGRFFVHRMSGREQTVQAGEKVVRLITKGDALDGQDTPVSPEEFLGRATRINRRHRHIDLESFNRIVLGRIVARFSRMSPLVYRPLRFAKHLFSR